MILGFDDGSRTVAGAEHLLHQVVEALGSPAGVIGCTHFVRSGALPHVACSLALPDSAHLDSVHLDPVHLDPAHLDPAHLDSARLPEGIWEAEGAALAAAEHASRDGGRVVLFPGRDDLPGTLTVGDLLARTAIDRVLVLAQPEPPADDVVLVTNDHVRPVWRDGLMTLLAMPAPGGRIAPAEVPNPTPCCADHV
ncbi:hypothetical protein [Microbispora sp. NPDC046933]|uniref:hypothetical protein n=1 Tax=Microbispora sp. NPDC046933 TaxID=3155618 RepID=UPI0033EFCA91